MLLFRVALLSMNNFPSAIRCSIITPQRGITTFKSRFPEIRANVGLRTQEVRRKMDRGRSNTFNFLTSHLHALLGGREVVPLNR
jgi:hypothetical protein